MILSVLKKDIHGFIFSTELFLNVIRGLKYTGLQKVNFFVGHPVPNTYWKEMRIPPDKKSKILLEITVLVNE